MKVLVVDDDEISRMPLVRLIGTLPGVTDVVEAEDGEAAWALLDAGLRPVLCCCDLYMPRLDGIGLLERTRGHPLLAPLPFVMMSSAADRDSVTRAVSAGAAGFIVKPYTPQTARPALERVLSKSRQRQVEAAAEVRNRLGISQTQLVQVTRRWQAEATTLLDGLDALDIEERQQALRRLHGAALTLGQLRCAELLEPVLGAGTEAVRAPVREVLLLADAWLAGAA
ncbi:response regulator [Hydrogenophaga sp. T2]|uniref:response regulator n=1 Tax=Hydrogenophaga sp. T2 TaxID=3132823 RepID=UPI003CF81074